ncbi:hypothetical protein BC827DRAFT_1129260 [Russula dissimulans]|nr:hypothetical protein BC827DRAFT_1129260 [Russula dissimulans]
MSHWRTIATRSRRQCHYHHHHQLSSRRWLHHAESDSERTTRPSRHAQFYSDLVPAMIPVALLGSAVYMGLQLLQTCLSHEKYLDEARARVEELEREIDTLVLERRYAHTPGAISTKDQENAAGSWFGWLKRG